MCYNAPNLVVKHLHKMAVKVGASQNLPGVLLYTTVPSITTYYAICMLMVGYLFPKMRLQPSRPAGRALGFAQEFRHVHNPALQFADVHQQVLEDVSVVTGQHHHLMTSIQAGCEACVDAS